MANEALRSHRYAMLLLRLELWLINGAWKSVIEPSLDGGLGTESSAQAVAEKGLVKRPRQLLKKGKARDEENE